MTANPPKVTLRIRLWVWARVILAQILAATEQDIKVTISATKMFLVFTIPTLLVMAIAHAEVGNETIPGVAVMIALGAVIAWRFVILAWTEAPILFRLVRFLLWQGLRVIFFVTPPAAVVTTLCFVVVAAVAFVTNPTAQLAYKHAWVWVAPLQMAILLGRPKAWNWLRTHTRTAASILVLQHVLFMGYGFKLFTNMGPSQKCEEQQDLSAVVTACKLQAAGYGDEGRRGVDHNVWLRVLKVKTQGAIPENADLEPRLSSCDSNIDCRFVYTTYGWNDGGPSAVVKIDLATGEIVKVYLGYSLFGVECLQGTGRCVVSSPMEGTVRLIDDEKDEILGGLRFEGYSPSYFFRVADPDVVGMVLVMNEQQVHAPPDVSFERVAPPCPEGRKCRIHAMYNLRTGEHREEVVVNPPTTLMGGEIYFAEYDPETDRLFTGAHLVQGSLERHQRPESFFLGLGFMIRSWSVATSAVKDHLTGETAVCFPFGGIQVFNRNMKWVRSLPATQGDRPMALVPGPRVLLVGNYYSGDLVALGYDDGQRLDSWNVGTRIRGITLTPQKDRALVTSASGTFMVDLRQFNSEPLDTTLSAERSDTAHTRS